MKKQTVLHLYGLALATGLFVFTGCSMLDFDGNGRFDPLEYLSNADVQVMWTDAEGNQYQLDPVRIGAEIVYNYIEKETGYRFELTPEQDGTMGIKVRDPEGKEIWIRPTAQQEPG